MKYRVEIQTNWGWATPSNGLKESYGEALAFVQGFILHASHPAIRILENDLEIDTWSSKGFLWPDIPIFPQPSPQVENQCGQCGLELQGVMGYVCMQPNCPTGLAGPTFSTT